ncbi:ubiquinone biosynthesis protein Coq7 [Blastocladiella britannica]|nr:ubiquinone biosynthesis protein Coq7 [Blastocladiella britannica]
MARRPLAAITASLYSTTTVSATTKPLSAAQRALIDSVLRVDQAGEIGANTIYQGQLAVLGRDPALRPVLEHMRDQEVVHLDAFNRLIPQWRARPSLLTPVWHAAGFAVGAASAALGKEGAMALTDAVETVIGEHYNDQVRKLVAILDEPGNENLERREELLELVETLKKFRDEELDHRTIALEHNAAGAPGAAILKPLLMTGCRAVIEVAKRV